MWGKWNENVINVWKYIAILYIFSTTKIPEIYFKNLLYISILFPKVFFFISKYFSSFIIFLYYFNKSFNFFLWKISDLKSSFFKIFFDNLHITRSNRFWENCSIFIQMLKIWLFFFSNQNMEKCLIETPNWQIMEVNQNCKNLM